MRKIIISAALLALSSQADACWLSQEQITAAAQQCGSTPDCGLISWLQPMGSGGQGCFKLTLNCASMVYGMSNAQAGQGQAGQDQNYATALGAKIANNIVTIHTMAPTCGGSGISTITLGQQ